ncbi:NUDIX hydrolase [Arthrobacter agilis]|uniref:NUDIX hydrolase n=1 Tax=Arthrobacter agilis TaxID=37921 RepID=UPI001EFD770A|nr:CoA pyrophosphatase [Arthrobacter agilis]
MLRATVWVPEHPRPSTGAGQGPRLDGAADGSGPGAGTGPGTLRDHVAAWVRATAASGTGLLRRDGWQLAALDPLTSRRAAVLILFGDAPSGAGAGRGGADPSRSGPADALHGLDLLFVMRSAGLSNHPGQVAFPGGATDAGDVDEGAAALREAQEETGLDPSGVEILGLLPEVGLPISNFMVTPVLGWWARQSPVRVMDRGESEHVFRCSVDALLDAANRRTAVLHREGFVSRTPAFLTPHVVIWGFTAMLLDAVFEGLGWTLPWDESMEIPAPL